jgi:topoisomerase-4 subunit A
MLLEQFTAEEPLSVVYYDGKTKQYFVKRFYIETTTLDKKFSFIAAAKGSRLVLVTTTTSPHVSITYRTSPDAPLQTLRYDLDALDVKGWKALGNRLTKHHVTHVELLS